MKPFCNGVYVQWYHFTTPGNSSYMLKCSNAQFVSLLDPHITDESHANAVLVKFLL